MRAWAETYGLPVVLTNCSNNYGPFHFPEKLIPVVILNALAGKPIPVYGAGENVRDWLYVEDHADALLLVEFAEDDQAVRHSPEALAEVLEPLAREGSARRAESASAYPA